MSIKNFKKLKISFKFLQVNVSTCLLTHLNGRQQTNTNICDINHNKCNNNVRLNVIQKTI